MMYRGRKGSGSSYLLQGRDWLEFQRRLEEVISEFHRVAQVTANLDDAVTETVERTDSGVEPAKRPEIRKASVESPAPSAQESTHPSSAIGRLKITVGPKPTRQQIMTALLQVLAANRVRQMN